MWHNRWQNYCNHKTRMAFLSQQLIHMYIYIWHNFIVVIFIIYMSISCILLRGNRIIMKVCFPITASMPCQQTRAQGSWYLLGFNLLNTYATVDISYHQWQSLQSVWYGFVNRNFRDWCHYCTFNNDQRPQQPWIHCIWFWNALERVEVWPTRYLRVDLYARWVCLKGSLVIYLKDKHTYVNDQLI